MLGSRLLRTHEPIYITLPCLFLYPNVFAFFLAAGTMLFVLFPAVLDRGGQAAQKGGGAAKKLMHKTLHAMSVSQC
jgi:hypothetical protein